MKQQKENKKNSLSTNIPVRYKIITLHNQNLRRIYLQQACVCVGGGVGGTKSMCSKHSRNDPDQGEQDLGMTLI